MEAWLHGAALNAQVPALKDLLEGLSTAPASDVCTLYVCIAAPRADEEDGAPVELYLTRDVSIPGTLWCASAYRRRPVPPLPDSVGAARTQAGAASGQAHGW
jgi:hypothetical protein